MRPAARVSESSFRAPLHGPELLNRVGAVASALSSPVRTSAPSEHLHVQVAAMSRCRLQRSVTISLILVRSPISFTSRGREQQLEEQFSCQWEGQARASARHWQVNLTAACRRSHSDSESDPVYPGSLSLSSLRLQAGLRVRAPGPAASKVPLSRPSLSLRAASRRSLMGPYAQRGDPAAARQVTSGQARKPAGIMMTVRTVAFLVIDRCFPFKKKAGRVIGQRGAFFSK